MNSRRNGVIDDLSRPGQPFPSPSGFLSPSGSAFAHLLVDEVFEQLIRIILGDAYTSIFREGNPLLLQLLLWSRFPRLKFHCVLFRLCLGCGLAFCR